MCPFPQKEMKLDLHREKRCLHQVRQRDSGIPGFNGRCPALLDRENRGIRMGKCRVRLNTNKMIGVGMRQEDKSGRSFSATHADNPQRCSACSGSLPGSIRIMTSGVVRM